MRDYKPSEGGESPLAKAPDWLEVKDPKTGKRGRRETNTMPQWAGSCWYYLRFIDPKNAAKGWEPDLERSWMPVDLYVGGAEHAVLHLLYARFWHKVLFDLGFVSTREPFQKLFNQGMVLAHAFKNSRGALVPSNEVDEKEDGSAVHAASGEVLERIVAKMSKSLRNVVTLDEIVDRYGADTFRMYLMFMGPLDTSRIWDPKAISGNYRFLRRAWAFVTGNQDSGVKAVIPVASQSHTVTKHIHKLVKKVTTDIETFGFNTAIAAMMEFLNAVEGSSVAKETLETFTLVLSPFAPHMGEELWERLGHSTSLAYQPWPTFDPDILVEDTISVVVQVNGKKRALVDVAASISEDDLKKEVVSALATTNFPVSGSEQFIVVKNPQTKAPKLVNVVGQ